MAKKDSYEVVLAMRAGVGNILLMDHKPERSKVGGGVGNPEKKEHRDQPAMGFLCT